MLPLEGITVVSLEQAIAAPFATRHLADLGARIIKIERPGSGDFARDYDSMARGLSAQFVWLNRSKESLTLDIKHAEARRILEGLLERADVFVQNLAPGAADRLGLGAESLARRYPRLIVCDISGYGAGGPYQDKKAYDLLIQAESGLLSLTGTPEAPAKVGVSVADISAGMYAYSGVLTALYQRERTGQGAALSVSLFDALGEWLTYPAYFWAYGGAAPTRSGSNHATIAPYGPFDGTDGQVYLAVQNEREWARFCEIALERPELKDDPRFESNSQRVAHREALHEAISSVFSALAVSEIVERLERAQIAHARMNTMQEFWNHAQLAERNRWREVETPVGPLRALMPPANLRDMEPHMEPVPTVGQHTEEILHELDYDDEAIRQLREDGAI